MKKKYTQEGIADSQLNSTEKETIANWLKCGYKLGSKQMTGNRKRARNYTFVLYEDDIPKDFFKRFRNLGYKMILSPIHNRDTNPDGTIKKSHYHLILLGSGNWINFEDLQDFVIKNFGGKGVAVPEKVSNVESLVRYFTHMDNPEKYQYDESEIQIYGNVDISKYFKFTESDKLSILDDILQYIENEEIYEIFVLIDYARKENEIWFKYLSTNSYVVDKYLTSKRNSKSGKKGNDFVSFLIDKKQK